MKFVFLSIWFLLLVVGAFTNRLIPVNFKYLYGFLFGTFSLVSLMFAIGD